MINVFENPFVLAMNNCGVQMKSQNFYQFRTSLPNNRNAACVSDDVIRKSTTLPSCLHTQPSSESLVTSSDQDIPMFSIDAPALGGAPMHDLSNGLRGDDAVGKIGFEEISLLDLPLGSGVSGNLGMPGMSAASSEVLTFPTSISTGRIGAPQQLPGILPSSCTANRIRFGTSMRTKAARTPSKPKESNDQTRARGPHSQVKLSSEEIKIQRAKRNRESAKRSRMKTKMIQEAMTTTFRELQEENRALRIVVNRVVACAENEPSDVQDKLNELLSSAGFLGASPDA